jgi:excisionase family DNA binding protein
MHSPYPPPEVNTLVRASARVATVAKLLDCHQCDIRRLVDAGELQAHTKGTRGVRVFLDSVADYQERQARRPRGTRKPIAAYPMRKTPPATSAFRIAMAGLKAKGLA